MATVKRCRDCPPGTRRKASYPGPRCREHHKAVTATRREAAWEKHIRETYGITAEQYWAIYDAQGGKCAICRRATGARRRLAVDHRHNTGEVFGLLCRTCNAKVLGHLRDDVDALRRAIEYLENPPAREAIGTVIVPSMRHS